MTDLRTDDLSAAAPSTPPLSFGNPEELTPVPAHRSAGARAVLERLEDVGRVVLTTHVNADGDGVGCQVALVDLLEARGIQARIVNPTRFPDQFRFLLPDEDPVLEAGTEAAAQWCMGADLCLVVDTGEVTRIGRVRPLTDQLPYLVVDHHPEGDRPIEGFAFRDESAAAAGELVHALAREADGPWTRSVVEGLWVALLTDTGSFRFCNNTAGPHPIAAELVDRGARPDLLHDRVYGAFPERRFRLLARSLDTLSRSPCGRVAWMTVPPDAWDELDCRAPDLEGFVDIPRSIEGVRVALLFREVPEGVKVSLRANGDARVDRVARKFEGGGHPKASGALVPGRPLEEVRAAMSQAAVEDLGRDPGAGER
ncbi:MAG: bifunctional oligoribonuclease/PAP phosphatase NrnA [Gemmatimonadales bacterium]|nr:MAG: bifunctional oligoribonuclease/PAP phosphatase NrnA [Gemmatimonadales bacterium]